MGTCAPDCFFREKFLRPGQGHDRLAHSHAIVTLVLAGRLDEVFAHGTQRCERWELHYKPRGAEHATATGPTGVRMFILGLRGPWLDGLDLPDGPRTAGGGVPAVRALRAFIGLAESRPRQVGPDAVTIRQLVDCLEPSGIGATPARPTWITEAHDLIRAEDAERTSLQRVAREFRVHEVYLARAFRRYYGRSIGSLRRRVRVDRAIGGLVRGTRPLAELAQELGYADQSHFTREFKQETGWSPGRLRATLAALGDRPSA